MSQEIGASNHAELRGGEFFPMESSARGAEADGVEGGANRCEVRGSTTIGRTGGSGFLKD